MTDDERMAIVHSYMVTPPHDDMPIPESVSLTDASILVAHLQEIGYGQR